MTIQAVKTNIKLAGKQIDIYKTTDGKYYFPYYDVSHLIKEKDYLDHACPIEANDGTHICVSFKEAINYWQIKAVAGNSIAQSILRLCMYEFIENLADKELGII